MRYILIFLCLFIQVQLTAQLDSLLKTYTNLQGKDRIYCLLDICFYYSQSNPIEGKKFGKLAYQESLNLNDLKITSDCLNDWSICYLTTGEMDSALILLDQCLDLRKKLGDPLLIAKTQSKRGTALLEKGELDLALSAFLESLSIFEEQKLIPFAALTKANIGNVYEKLGQHDRAEKSYQELLEISRAHQIKNYEFTALGALAKLKSKAGDWEKANQLFTAAEKVITPNLEPANLGLFYQNYGINCRHLKELNKSILLLKEALSVYHSIPDELSVSYTLLNLTNVYLDKGEISNANKTATDGFDIAKKISAFNLLKYAYKTLARLAYLSNDDQKGDEYIEQFEAYKDSINNVESQKNIDRLMIEYQTAEKEKALLAAQIKNNQYALLLSISLLIIAVISIFALIKFQKSKIRQKKLDLENQRKLNHERIRIARDLHDHLGAEITYLAAKLDIISEQYKTNDILPQLANNARSAGQMMRETIWSIKNEQITTEDLFLKASEYCEKIKIGLSQEIQITFSNQSIQLSPSQALSSFRIIQESIQNAIKHAACSNINIAIYNNTISIKDNGHGFSLDEHSSGNGISNMQERARENDMELRITSDTNGTEITLYLSESVND